MRERAPESKRVMCSYITSTLNWRQILDALSCDRPDVALAHPAHIWQSMSMNTEGLRSTTTSNIDIQDAFKRHYSSRALQNSNHIMTNVRVEEEEDANIIAVLEKSAPKQTLSEIRRTHSDQMFASICESNTSVGSTRILVRSKSHKGVSMVASDMSDQQIPYHNNGKATIDRNFFKSMAKMIKANRPSRSDADVVNEKACAHYTACNTSNSSCGEKTGYVWIEGHAMRVRIDLKFHLLHERMLACEASNDPCQWEPDWPPNYVTTSFIYTFINILNLASSSWCNPIVHKLTLHYTWPRVCEWVTIRVRASQFSVVNLQWKRDKSFLQSIRLAWKDWQRM